MKNKINIFTVFIASSVIFSSCLKERIGNIYTGGDNTANVVEFKNTGNNQAVQASKYPRFHGDLGTIPVGGSGTMNINVSYSGANAAPADLTVTLAVDEEALSLFNEQNGSDFIIPPSEVFSFPSTVVIKKGERQTTVQLEINVTNSFDFAASYAIPLKIASVTPSQVISGNFGSALFSFGVRNKFDGVYDFKGYILREGDNKLSGNFKGYQRNLVTTGPNSVTFAQLWADGSGTAGIDGLTLTVDPLTNKVKVSSTSNPAVVNLPTYDNRYDPATKTFYVSFYWGSGPQNRAATDTLTYKNAR